MSETRRRHALPPLVQIAIVVAIFFVVGLSLLFASLVSRATAPAVAQPPPDPPAGFFKPTELQWESLGIAPVKQIEFSDVTESDGSVVAADDATTQIFSPFTGRVNEVFVTTGDTVRAGAPLFAGEAAEYAQAQNDLATAQQTLDAARIQLKVTQANRERLLKLLRLDGATRKDVEQSRADVASALAAVLNAETAATLARSHFHLLGVSAGSNDGSVVVRAPVDGTITQRAVGEGEYVESAASGGSQALLTISDTSRVFFVANVTETDLARIHIGDRVEMRLLAYPGRVFDAQVTYIAPLVDPNTHRIAVRAQASNPDGALKAGMYGNVSIYTGLPSLEIVVPEDAVIFEGETARVWLAGPNRTLALRQIRAGRTIDGMVEVLEGLRPGDHVVTSGSLFIDRASQGDD